MPSTDLLSGHDIDDTAEGIRSETNRNHSSISTCRCVETEQSMSVSNTPVPGTIEINIGEIYYAAVFSRDNLSLQFYRLLRHDGNGYKSGYYNMAAQCNGISARHNTKLSEKCFPDKSHISYRKNTK